MYGIGPFNLELGLGLGGLATWTLTRAEGLLIISLFQMKEVVSHDRDTRTTRTYYGLQFKLQVSGKAKRFSWSKLISEIVITFGLLGVVNNVLDLVWQLVFPLLGFPDYNDLVYRSVGPGGQQEDSGIGSQENSCQEKETEGKEGQERKERGEDILSPDL